MWPKHRYTAKGSPKLVYYAQGFALALLDRPLFPQHIEAWIYGPVVPALYREYKSYEADTIPSPQKLDFSKSDCA
jgi:uncharacterized phage-associated protein